MLLGAFVFVDGCDTTQSFIWEGVRTLEITLSKKCRNHFVLIIVKNTQGRSELKKSFSSHHWAWSKLVPYPYQSILSSLNISMAPTCIGVLDTIDTNAIVIFDNVFPFLFHMHMLSHLVALKLRVNNKWKHR